MYKRLILPQAVCVLLPTESKAFGSRYIAISRRDSTTEFGIPGGKVDAGETVVQAAVREIEEELQLNLIPSMLIPVYAGMCKGDTSFWVTTFLYEDSFDIADVVPEHGMTVRAMQSFELVLPSISPFAEYNIRVFSAMGSLFKN